MVDRLVTAQQLAAATTQQLWISAQAAWRERLHPQDLRSRVRHPWITCDGLDTWGSGRGPNSPALVGSMTDGTCCLVPTVSLTAWWTVQASKRWLACSMFPWLVILQQAPQCLCVLRWPACVHAAHASRHLPPPHRHGTLKLGCPCTGWAGSQERERRHEDAGHRSILRHIRRSAGEWTASHPCAIDSPLLPPPLPGSTRISWSIPSLTK